MEGYRWGSKWAAVGAFPEWPRANRRLNGIHEREVDQVVMPATYAAPVLSTAMAMP